MIAIGRAGLLLVLLPAQLLATPPDQPALPEIFPSHLRPSQIVRSPMVRSYVPSLGCLDWSEMQKLAGAAPSREAMQLDRPATIASLAGRRVRRLVVDSLCFGYHRRTWPGTVHLLDTVWRGQFRLAAPRIPWAESTIDAISAVIEFETGAAPVPAPGRLVTDGRHVALRDAQGRYWFVRLGD